MTQRAFSLVELSIVLVILGLLVGGVLSGQSLIRAAELRAVGTEYQRYVAASQSFRDKYFALPGDMTNATSFWGKDAAICNAQTGTAATPGTCNGNGNGLIPLAGIEPYEQHRLWQHLALAGLIEGSYTGVAGTGGASHCQVGINCPRSKAGGNNGWGIEAYANYAGDAGWYAFAYNNVLVTGAQTTTENPSTAAFKPEEAWNIDTKLDDGRPALGKVLAVRWSTCTTSTTFSDTAGVYRLDSSSPACGIVFPNAF